MHGPRTFENRLALLVCIATSIPGFAVLLCLWLLGSSPYVIGAVVFMLVCLVLYATVQVRNSVDYQFRSLQNLLDAVTAGDYSLRVATSTRAGALREVFASVNELVSTLQSEKQRAEEHQLLLDKVIDQIDVAILAWDGSGRISFMNPCARQLLLPAGAQHLPALLCRLEQLPLKKAEVRELPLGEPGARFRLYRDQYFSGGNCLALLFITNVDTLLRKEEKRAWQNLIRVISHEINNSLVPLASMSETMRTQVRKREQDDQLAQELDEGLGLIRQRSESLSAFLTRYRLIANLPEPALVRIALPERIEDVSRLFDAVKIETHGDALEFHVDAAQFDQLMINLLKNAIEAQAERGVDEEITISWELQDSCVCISIADRGGGIQNPENLFTPLYTTRKRGQGIGLVLCREIAEAHGGTLTLDNRDDGLGCIARVRFPIVAVLPDVRT
ncbi:MAG: ATP-binding protein [Pseudomonadota bacterium]|nr:ATP-binding protein [Pseudomonadota bacterium]